MFRRTSAASAVLASLALALIGSASAPCPVNAQGGGCVEGCRAIYGDCYKSTSNRAACEAKLQRCMQGCIASKRH